jgi:hypothetical protein
VEILLEVTFFLQIVTKLFRYLFIMAGGAFILDIRLITFLRTMVYVHTSIIISKIRVQCNVASLHLPVFAVE